MADTLTAFSVDDGQAHEFRIFDDAGAQVGGVIAATTGVAGTYKYTATVPGTTPAGAYTFALYRTSNGRLRSQGEFYWDGADIVIPAQDTQRLVDLAEADEVTAITGGTGTVEKRLAGTATVLLTKDVSLGTTCDINSSVTQP